MSSTNDQKPTLPDRAPPSRDAFRNQLEQLVAELPPYIAGESGEWTIKGFVDLYKNVYSVSGDTKLLSKILEIHLFPRLLAFAERFRYRVVPAECQNWYPDFSFISDEDYTVKFALDLKTTYRDEDFPGHVNGFTLGSHGEYFQNRSSNKNIQFPYSEYSGHFCLGIIYSRDASSQSDTIVYTVDELGSAREDVPAAQVDHLKSIPSVISNLQFFVCEKWEIASDHQGSSNTANIGGITWIDDILARNGVFKHLGETFFDEYWMNYGKIILPKAKGKTKKITTLREYLRYKGMDEALANPKRTKQKGPRVKKEASRGDSTDQVPGN